MKKSATKYSLIRALGKIITIYRRLLLASSTTNINTDSSMPPTSTSSAIESTSDICLTLFKPHNLRISII